MSAIKLNAHNLKQLQKLHRMKEVELAKKIGVSSQTLRRALAGENVSAAFVSGACIALGAPFDTLFKLVHDTPQAA